MTDREHARNTAYLRLGELATARRKQRTPYLEPSSAPSVKDRSSDYNRSRDAGL